jgi:hypothetical protein
MKLSACYKNDCLDQDVIGNNGVGRPASGVGDISSSRILCTVAHSSCYTQSPICEFLDLGVHLFFGQYAQIDKVCCACIIMAAFSMLRSQGKFSKSCSKVNEERGSFLF